jgi:hypothetical protein
MSGIYGFYRDTTTLRIFRLRNDRLAALPVEAATNRATHS